MTNFWKMGQVFTDGETTIRWTIPNIMQSPKVMGNVFYTPCFTFRGEYPRWLAVFPYGHKYCNSEGFVSLSCYLPNLPPGSNVRCCMVDGQGREVLHSETVMQDGYLYQNRWILRAELDAQSTTLLPEGQLRIVCRIVPPDERGHGADQEPNSGTEVGVTNLGECSNSTSDILINAGAEVGVTNLGECSNSSSDTLINAGADGGVANLGECSNSRSDTLNAGGEDRTNIGRQSLSQNETVLGANEWGIFNKDYMADAKQLRSETLERQRFVKKKKVTPNDFSDNIYRKLVALARHTNNRDYALINISVKL